MNTASNNSVRSSPIRALLHRGALLAALSGVATVTRAQSEPAPTDQPPPEPEAPPPEVPLPAGAPAAQAVDLQEQLDALQRTVAEQQQALDALREQAEEERRKREATDAAQPPAAAPKPGRAADASLSDHGTSLRHVPTLRDEHVGSPRPGNAPVDAEYQGYWPVFDGKLWLKLGGYVKLDGIVDSTRVGNPDKFVTSAIPIEGQAQYGSPEQFNMHGKQTRLSLDLRAPTSIGSLRVMYENDFYGDGTSSVMSYNLRHFYIQVANFTLGQTWTAFVDSDVFPDTLDFAGPGTQAVLRQAQARYTFSPVSERMHVALSVELPSSDVVLLPDTASARRLAPDVAAHVRWEGPHGHVQIAGVGRVLAFDDQFGPDDEAFGWGASLAGSLNTWGKDTLIGSITYGDGIGRYMQDLSDKYGAYVDADGDLQTVAAWGLHAGYRHFWFTPLSTQLSYGYLSVDSPTALGTSAYDYTHYAQGNLVLSPMAGLFVGVEYLFGFKQTIDGNDGHAHRGQLSVQYKFQ